MEFGKYYLECSQYWIWILLVSQISIVQYAQVGQIKGDHPIWGLTINHLGDGHGVCSGEGGLLPLTAVHVC